MENRTENSNCSVYNNKDFVNVAIAYQATAGFTFLSCIFALSIIIIFKKWQLFSQRLFIYLVISTFLFSAARIFHRVDYLEKEFTDAHMHFCIFIAFISQNLAWTIFTSNLAITVYLFLGAVCNRRSEKYELAYVFLIFGLPWTFNWLPFIKGTYGKAGAWCWIKSVNLDTCTRLEYGVVLQLLLFFLPIFVILLTQVILYLIILCKLYVNKKRWKGTIANTVEDEATNKAARNEFLSLLAYPLIYIITSIFLVGNRVHGWIYPGNPSLVFFYLSAIAFPLQGIIIVLVFTFNADTRRRLRCSHFKEAIKSYKTSKVVSEYELDDQMESVYYKEFTDNTSVEKLEIN